jgi:hypothetical protein
MPAALQFPPDLKQFRSSTSTEMTRATSKDVALVISVEVIAKTSNSLRTLVNEWSEFFKYNPPVFESDKLTLIS